MNDPLFQIDRASSRKRKPQATSTAKPKGGRESKKKEDVNEDVFSDDEESDARVDSDAEESETEDRETAAEKRVRLAREYLEQLKHGEREEDSDREIDHDAISHRLRQEHLEAERKLDRNVAHKYTTIPPESDVIRLRHKKPITCLALSTNDRWLFTACKDSTIIKWDLSTRHKVGTIQRGDPGKSNGHVGHILALAVSSDGKYLASGGRDRTLYVWDSESLTLIKALKSHRDTISGLAFRKGTHTLYSASFDRTVKIWSLDEMCYVETLFGHQDCVTAIDSLYRETCVTVGGRDRTARLFKIADESQLIFNGHVMNTECVRMVNEQMFITCGEDGTICLWTTFKKKPAFSAQRAHYKSTADKDVGTDDAASSDEDDKDDKVGNTNNTEVATEPLVVPGVISLAALPYTDLIASGSNTGEIKLWRVTPEKKLECILDLPVPGYINAMAFSSSGNFLVAAVAQEHRLGRWGRIVKSRNEVRIFPLLSTDVESTDAATTTNGALRGRKKAQQ